MPDTEDLMTQYRLKQDVHALIGKGTAVELIRKDVAGITQVRFAVYMGVPESWIEKVEEAPIGDRDGR